MEGKIRRRRIKYRYYEDDEKYFTELCKHYDCNKSEVIRKLIEDEYIWLRNKGMILKFKDVTFKKTPHVRLSRYYGYKVEMTVRMNDFEMRMLDAVANIYRADRTKLIETLLEDAYLKLQGKRSLLKEYFEDHYLY